MDQQAATTMIPWIEVDPKTLPSRGIAYPPDAKIRYRTYSFGEVKMASAGTPQIVQMIESTMAGIATDGFQKDQITFLDSLYLGLLRKVSTVRDGEYEIPFICDKCGTEGKQKFREKDLDFQEIDEEIRELPIKITLESVLDKEGGKIKLDIVPLKVRDFLILQRGRYKEDIIGGKPDRVSLNALMVSNMDFKEAYNILYTLKDADDIAAIELVDKLLLHDVKPLKVTCKEQDEDGLTCNHVNEITLSGREQLIRPFRNGDESVRSRISFGVPRDN